MRIIFSKLFEKQLSKAARKIKGAFRKRLALFIADRYNPILENHPLTGELKGYRSINITGDWRALFREIKEDTIFFSALGTHSQLYR